MHTARLAALGASTELIGALRDPDRAEPLPDERLELVRVFTRRVLDTAGDVGDQALRDFLAAGFTAQNALEVVLGTGTYTMSTLAKFRQPTAEGFLVCLRDGGALAGMITIDSIIRGRFQSASVSGGPSPAR